MKIKPGLKKNPVYIINMYNAPPGSYRAGVAAKQVMAVPRLIQKNSIIMGDMNLYHTDWDNQTRNPSAQARILADWISDNHATYKLDSGTITLSQGRTLHLVISSNTVSDQITECYVEPQLQTTSDHETLLKCLEFEGVIAKKPTGVKFRLEKIDKKQFCASLEGQKDLVCTSLHQAKSALEKDRNSC